MSQRAVIHVYMNCTSCCPGEHPRSTVSLVLRSPSSSCFLPSFRDSRREPHNTSSPILALLFDRSVTHSSFVSSSLGNLPANTMLRYIKSIPVRHLVLFGGESVSMCPYTSLLQFSQISTASHVHLLSRGHQPFQPVTPPSCSSPASWHDISLISPIRNLDLCHLSVEISSICGTLFLADTPLVPPWYKAAFPHPPLRV